MSYNSNRSPRPSHSHNKLLLLALLVVVAVVLAGLTMLYLHHVNPKGTNTPKLSTASTPAPPNTVDYSSNAPTDSTTTATKTQISPTPGATKDSSINTPAPTTISVTVTRAGNSTDGSGNPVVAVGSLVQGTASGTCTLEATQSGQPSVVSQQTVASQGTTYGCNFIIGYDKFPAGGAWSFKISQNHMMRTRPQYTKPITKNMKLL